MWPRISSLTSTSHFSRLYNGQNSSQGMEWLWRVMRRCVCSTSTQWQHCQQKLFLAVSQQGLGCFTEISRPWRRLTLLASSPPWDSKSMCYLFLSVAGRCHWGDHPSPPFCKEACRSKAPGLFQDPCLLCTSHHPASAGTARTDCDGDGSSKVFHV